MLKIFSGYKTCASQPDSWHQYSPAVATDRQAGYSYAISPGFWLKGQAVRLARDLARWNTNVSAMVASAEKWQLVTTFNEWGEGTSVEIGCRMGFSFGLRPIPGCVAQQWRWSAFADQYPAGTDAHRYSHTGCDPICYSHSAAGSDSHSYPDPDCHPAIWRVDPIIFFTGDLVSSSSKSRAQLVVNLIRNLMAQHPGTQMLVASTGDNEQENNPTVANYQDNFGATYGTFVSQGIFMQVRGNHDIQSAGAYTDYNGTSHSSGRPTGITLEPMPMRPISAVRS